MKTLLDTVRLSKREARAALALIDDLQPEAPLELDWQECILISLRGRLRDKRREVPAKLWPELSAWLETAPGILKEVSPRRDLGRDDAGELIHQLMAWHVWAFFTPDIDPLWVLLSEGLLNSLVVEPQTIVGAAMLELVAMVQEQRFPQCRSWAA